MEEWIDMSQTKGFGNAKVKVGGIKNTGRNNRNTIVSFFTTPAAGVKESLNVTQKGAEEFVSFSCIKEIIVEQKGGLLQLEGLSNSSALTFKLGNGNLNISLPDEYNAGGLKTANGETINSDPGGHDAFRFSIELTIPENIEGTSVRRELHVLANNGSRHVILIRQDSV
jgi:hypothetical protein